MLKFHPLRVSAIRPEADEAVSLTLDVPSELRETFRAQAGQHVVLRSQADGEELRRTYSLVNAAGELPLRIVARTHPKGRFSRLLASKVRAGDSLDVMPPNGGFGPRSPQTKGATYAAFASGCGITPVISIVKTLLETDPACRVLVFYGNRESGRAMLLEDLLALKDRFLDRLSLQFVMSREPQEIDLLNGRIDAEKVKTFASTLFDPKQVSDFFLCGPGTMIDDVRATLQSLGVEPAHIHAEHFTTDTVAHSAQPTQVEKASEGVTTVTVIMDGRRRTFTMPSEGENILDAAARAGLDLPFSCKAGVCSTCRTKLTQGKVELAQNYALEDWELEQGFILACQAHAKTPEIELNYDET